MKRTLEAHPDDLQEEIRIKLAQLTPENKKRVWELLSSLESPKDRLSFEEPV